SRSLKSDNTAHREPLIPVKYQKGLHKFGGYPSTRRRESRKMKIEKITNPDCLCDFAHGAVIKTKSGRFLGATCDPEEAENIIKAYFQTEFFPEPVHVLFDGIWGYTYSLISYIKGGK